MPPPGHDQLTRHAAPWCARWPPVPGVSVAGHSRPAGNVVMHDCDLRPGKAVGRHRDGTAHLAGDGACTASRLSSGPEGNR